MNNCFFRLDVLWQQELSKNGPSAASFTMVVWRFVRTRVCISCFLLSCSLVFGFMSPVRLFLLITNNIEQINHYIQL